MEAGDVVRSAECLPTMPKALALHKEILSMALGLDMVSVIPSFKR